MFTIKATESQQELSVNEAKKLFQQLGCVSCHMENGVAEPFDEILKEMGELASQYNGNIDAYVKEKVEYFGGQKFNSFDEMMKVMQSNVGASDEDIAKLSAFFKSYFEKATKEEGKTQQVTQEEKQTTKEEQTPAQGVEEKPTAAGKEKPTKQTTSNVAAIVFGVAAIIIIAVILVVLTAKK